MRHARRFRAALAVALPLLVAGCGFLNECTFESRAVGAAGRVIEGTTEIANASLTVAGTRGSFNDRAVQWVVTSTSLAGHVTSVALIRASQPDPVLIDLPFQPPQDAMVYVGNLRQVEPETTPELDGLFEIVAANEAALEIRTNLADRPVVRIPLTVTQHEGWRRPNCS